MNTEQTTNNELIKKAVEIAIRIGVLGILIFWCFQIVKPFITLIIWGIIIAIGLYPAFIYLLNKLAGGKEGRAAFLMTALMLMLLATPVVLLGSIVVENAQMLAENMDGPIHIPPPPEYVVNWPIIGDSLASFWTLASTNIEKALEMLAPQLKIVGGWVISAAASTGLGVLQFIASIIISGILLANSNGAAKGAKIIAERIAGENGGELIKLAEITIRGVAKGVLGVALIQSILAGLGFVVAGVPGAGILAMMCLFLAVIQIGPGLVIIPVVIYVFSIHDGIFAGLFLIWSIFVTLLDNVLKPLLMGKGIDIPMIVIFLGAIGGMLLSGIIGLFVGAVVLALGYKVSVAWLNEKNFVEKV